MAQLINEAKRFQKLAGLITESQINEDFTMPVYNPETKQEEEKSVKFTAFDVGHKKMDNGTYPVFIGLDVPAENRANSDFNKGKMAIGTYVNDKGESTGQFWLPGMSNTDSEAQIKKIKNWDALKAYAKDEFLKFEKEYNIKESIDIDSVVNEALETFRKENK